jgi:hypothetical protein
VLRSPEEMALAVVNRDGGDVDMKSTLSLSSELNLKSRIDVFRDFYGAFWRSEGAFAFRYVFDYFLVFPRCDPCQDQIDSVLYSSGYRQAGRKTE